MERLILASNRLPVKAKRENGDLEYEESIGGRSIDIVAEHGLWIRVKGGDWELTRAVNDEWKELVRPILDTYTLNTPGSFVEEKSSSLAWHYRKAEQAHAKVQLGELLPVLSEMTSKLPVGILEGNKVIEIKDQNISKGATAMKWLGKEEWPFVLAIGDDNTDEEMFKVVPERGFTVKVGLSSTGARYNIRDYEEARNLLTGLVE